MKQHTILLIKCFDSKQFVVDPSDADINLVVQGDTKNKQASQKTNRPHQKNKNKNLKHFM